MGPLAAKGNRYEILSDDGSGQWSSRAGRLVPAWKSGQRLAATYKHQVFHGNAASGGTFNATSYRFSPDGRFEILRYVQSGSGSVASATSGVTPAAQAIRRLRHAGIGGRSRTRRCRQYVFTQGRWRQLSRQLSSLRLFARIEIRRRPQRDVSARRGRRSQGHLHLGTNLTSVRVPYRGMSRPAARQESALQLSQ